MRKLSLLLVAGMALYASSCGNSSESDKAATADSQQVSATTGRQYAADLANSSIQWRATHKGGMAPRWGTINITQGDLAADNGKLTGGSFAIDMNSLKVDSASVTEAGKKYTDLENHLKSADFFDVAQYPAAKFEITGVESFDSAKDQSILQGATNIVSGNLSIKGKTVNVKFPAIISVSDNSMDVQAKFNVDRTTWDLKFGTDGDPKEWMVSKDFELDINLKAVAK